MKMKINTNSQNPINLSQAQCSDRQIINVEIAVHLLWKIEVERQDPTTKRRRRATILHLIDHGRGRAAVAVAIIARDRPDRSPVDGHGDPIRNPRSAGRLHGAAQAAARGPIDIESVAGDLAVEPIVSLVEARGLGPDGLGIRGEVRPRLGAVDPARRRVVGSRRVLGRGEGAQPDPALLRRVPDLRRELAPRALPHASVPDLQRRSGVRRREIRRARGGSGPSHGWEGGGSAVGGYWAKLRR